MVLKPLATASQLLASRLENRRPVLCPICHQYVATRLGRPVVLNRKESIVEFAHQACCVAQ